MAALLTNKGELAIIESWLRGRNNWAASGSDTLIPNSSGGNYGIGLAVDSRNTPATGPVAAGTSVLDKTSNLGTVGASKKLVEVSGGGYARQAIARSTTSTWTDPVLSATSYQTTSPQVSFEFTSTPTQPQANVWFVAGSTNSAHDNILFMADLSALRTFGNGDIEKVTASVLLG